MGRRIEVQAVLTVEILDELELAEAGFRAFRQGFGAAVDDGEGISAEDQALVDAATRTPEFALTSLLGGPRGALGSLNIPGARVVSVSTSGPMIGPEAD